jgi:hypothetical protein
MNFITSYNTLNVSNQGLTELPEIESYINFVDCSGNNIEYIESLPDSVISLNCSFNPLKNLDFIKGSKLQYLYIQGVRISISEIPDSLTLLDCKFCRLTELPELKNLTVLNCKGNKLTKLNLNDNLTILDASKNFISSINNFPKNLIYLDLAHNKLSSIPSLHDTITFLKLGDNPFNVENLPPIPVYFSVLSMPKVVFNKVKGINESTIVKYINGDESELCTDITIEDFKSRDRREIVNINKKIMCSDIIMGDEYELIEYLGNNTNNIVINSNGIFYCYKRSELKKHLFVFTNCFINQIISDITGEKLFKLYLREYITIEGLNMIMNRRYSIYKLNKTQRIINLNDSNEQVYDVSGYSLSDYLSSSI